MTIINDAKYYRIINQLKIHTNKSSLSHRHAAGIVYKNKLISKGVNAIQAGRSEHAELSAISKFIKRYGTTLKESVILPKNVTRSLNKITVIVIRYHNEKLVLSKPCKHCINLMKKIGIKKIYYSNEKGQVIYDKINSITTNHVSILRKNIKKIDSIR